MRAVGGANEDPCMTAEHCGKAGRQLLCAEVQHQDTGAQQVSFAPQPSLAPWQDPS